MKNELMQTNGSVEKISFTQDQVQLIKKQIAPKATDSELQLFLYQAKRSGLDPLTRQIYAIHRRSNGEEKMTIQTSIDGFRVIAERSGVYAGQSEPEYVEDNGKIVCCKVRVFKFNQGQRYEAAVGVAYWNEYVQSTPLWTKMPHTMIAKCAESLALRKAFPQDLSGLYTAEEMEQSYTEDVTPSEATTQLPALTDQQYIKALGRIATGERGLIEKLEKAFTLTDNQRKGLEDKISLVKQAAQTQMPVEQEPA